MVRDLKEKERERRALLSCAGWPVSFEFSVLDMVCLWNEGVPSFPFVPPCGVWSSERIFNALI